MPKENKINPADEPKLSVYQKMLLNEFQNKPEIMQLLKCIFNDYPQVILVEHMTAKGATKRRRAKSIECAHLRMKMEAFIEEKIARLAGIDVDKFAAIQKEVDAAGIKQLELDKAKTLVGAMDVVSENIAKEITKEEDEKALKSVAELVLPTTPSEVKGEKNE